MKQLIALQSVLNTLGVEKMDNRLDDSTCQKPFYVISIYPNSIDLQGVFTTTMAGLIMKKFPESKSNVDELGYVRLEFEQDGFTFNVCLA